MGARFSAKSMVVRIVALPYERAAYLPHVSDQRRLEEYIVRPN